MGNWTPPEEKPLKMNRSMTSDRDGESECGRAIPSGTTVTYVCHVGWPVKVRLADGAEVVVNPSIFPQLRG